MAIYLTDVSSNNHPGGSSINWAAVKASGISAAFIKATQGTNYTNPFFFSDLGAARQAGLQVAAYHFADFGNVQGEAAYFKSVAGAYAKVLDSETSTDAAWQQAFLDAVGMPVGERMNYGSESTLPGAPAVNALRWVAAYGQPNPPPASACWQFTSTAVIAGLGQADKSVWTGPQEQYDAFFGVAKREDEQVLIFQNPGGGQGLYSGGRLVAITGSKNAQGVPNSGAIQAAGIEVVDISQDQWELLVGS